MMLGPFANHHSGRYVRYVVRVLFMFVFFCSVSSKMKVLTEILTGLGKQLLVRVSLVVNTNLKQLWYRMSAISALRMWKPEDQKFTFILRHIESTKVESTKLV